MPLYKMIYGVWEVEEIRKKSCSWLLIKKLVKGETLMKRIEILERKVPNSAAAGGDMPTTEPPRPTSPTEDRHSHAAVQDRALPQLGQARSTSTGGV
jgi:hypothetical protein